MEREKYPVFIKQDKSEMEGASWLVFVPDYCAYTEGYDLEDAKRMAIDLINLEVETDSPLGLQTPAPSDPDEARRKAKEDADEIFDFSDGELVYL